MHIYALDTSGKSALQLGRSLELQKLPEGFLHLAIFTIGQLYSCGQGPAQGSQNQILL